MKYLKFLLALLVASPVFGALTASTIWSVQASGSTNNGGGFDPSQTAGMLTNLASTSSSSTTPTFSSVSYTFVGGDVGDWVFVGAGTSWQTGFYKITSISGNNAVVDAAIGHVVLYNTTTGVFSLSTVAGCGATTGGTFSVDYAGPVTSSARFTDATLASVGSSTTLTDSAADFTPVDVGNMIHITNAGTGGFGLTQWFTITAYASTTSVTTDRTTNSGTAMVAGTGAVGGGVALIDNINSSTVGLGPVAGNTLWLNGSFTQANAITWAPVPTSTSPIRIVGYGTYWGDGYLGRTNGSGALITTNMPTLAFASAKNLVCTTPTFTIFENLVITGTESGPLLQIGGSDAAVRCSINNAGVNASATVITASSAGAVIFGCDLAESSATLATTGILCNSTCKIKGNRITLASTNAAAAAISSNSSPAIIGNQIFGAGGLGVFVSGTGGSPMLDGNTIVGFVDDFNVITGDTILQFASDNMLTDCTNPINNVITSNATMGAYNRYRQNTSGGTNTITTAGTMSYMTNYSAVVSALSATDYQNASSDLRLLSTSPAIGSGFFPLASVGAVQSSQTGGVGQTSGGSSQ